MNQVLSMDLLGCKSAPSITEAAACGPAQGLQSCRSSLEPGTSVTLNPLFVVGENTAVSILSASQIASETGTHMS